MHPWGPLPVYLFQDCRLSSERGGVCLEALTSGALKEHKERADPGFLLI